MARKGQDLTGQKFGKLTVLGHGGYIQNSRQRISVWECRCECGNTYAAPGYLLLSGRRKSCGCMRVPQEGLAGLRFGKLTVLGEDTEDGTTLRKVICRCDCGKEFRTAFRNLKNGSVTSCGCDQPRTAVRKELQERQYGEAFERKLESFRSGDTSCVQDLTDWVYIWIREVLPNVVKDSTRLLYEETMERHVLPAMGSKRLEEITPETVSGWVGHLRGEPLPGTMSGKMSEGTVRNTLSVLSGCLRDAQKYKLIRENPCVETAWPLPGKNVRADHSWLTEEQVRQLTEILSSRQEDHFPLEAGFELMLYGGLSLSEAAALRWKDVDLDGRRLFVHQLMAARRTREGGTEYEPEELSGRRRRSVPISVKLTERLKQLRGQGEKEDERFVLGEDPGQPVNMDRIRTALMRRAREAGIGQVTPRMLRDTYAIRAVEAGATSDMVAELMGYASSRQVIRRYMPGLPDNCKSLVDRMHW
ncbi:MAG: tyrosine-type recombinase/integrase [Eubacteriales bacterium]|nr:tyrosine-type recombinase/integrase [Eubacteriales bacterium]